MSAEPLPPWTVEEWLAYEQSHEGRRELVAGNLVEVTGATDRHDITAGVLVERLSGPFLKLGCLTYAHNRRVVTPSGEGYYPDVLVRCGPRSHDLYDKSPSWIFEVLSPSNNPAVQQRKLIHYLSIDGLEGYVVLDPDDETVVGHLRGGHGIGERRRFSTLDLTHSNLLVGPVDLDFDAVFEEVALRVRLGDG